MPRKPVRQPMVFRKTTHVALRLTEKEAERLTAAARHREFGTNTGFLRSLLAPFIDPGRSVKRDQLTKPRTRTTRRKARR